MTLNIEWDSEWDMVSDSDKVTVVNRQSFQRKILETSKTKRKSTYRIKEEGRWTHQGLLFWCKKEPRAAHTRGSQAITWLNTLEELSPRRLPDGY